MVSPAKTRSLHLHLLVEVPEREPERSQALEHMNLILQAIQKEWGFNPNWYPLRIWVQAFGKGVSRRWIRLEGSFVPAMLLTGADTVTPEEAMASLIRMPPALILEPFTETHTLFVIALCSSSAAGRLARCCPLWNAPFHRAQRWMLLRDKPDPAMDLEPFTGMKAMPGMGNFHAPCIPTDTGPMTETYLHMHSFLQSLHSSQDSLRPLDLIHPDPVFPYEQDCGGLMIQPDPVSPYEPQHPGYMVPNKPEDPFVPAEPEEPVEMGYMTLEPEDDGPDSTFGTPDNNDKFNW